MKAKIESNKNVLNLKEKLGDSEQVKKELEEIITNFEKWLELSNLTFEEFIQYKNVENFQILKFEKDSYVIVRFIFNETSFIGEQMAYEKENMYGKYDMILLILYIAARLDEANAGQRKNYFWNIAKQFCNKLEKG